MSEEIKQPEAEETVETPETEAEQETAAEETEKKGRKKKEKGISFTREQEEQMELAVKQLEAVEDQRTRRAAELHLRAAEYRDQKTGDDGRDQTLGGAYTRCNTKSDGQRNGHNTDNDAGHSVAHEGRFVIGFQTTEEFGSEVDCVTKLHDTVLLKDQLICY